MRDSDFPGTGLGIGRSRAAVRLVNEDGEGSGVLLRVLGFAASPHMHRLATGSNPCKSAREAGCGSRSSVPSREYGPDEAGRRKKLESAEGGVWVFSASVQASQQALICLIWPRIELRADEEFEPRSRAGKMKRAIFDM